MSDDTKLYISLESHAGHLVIDGPMSLWRELVGSLATGATEPAPPDQREPARPTAETARR